MEIINLDMTPSTVTPNAHAGQYDSARTVRFMLKNCGTPYTLAGTETITAEITRSDNTEVTVNVTNTSSNYVDVVFDDTVCTVKGLYACELRLKDSDGFDIGSKNFALLVQRDPYDGAGVRIVTVGPADICTFETTLPEPLQSVLVNVEATGGNGTPDSPIPINGYTEANITRCGKNLAHLEQGSINIATGEETTSNTRVRTQFIKIKPSTYYKATSEDNGWDIRNGCLYDENKNFIRGGIYPNSSGVLLTPVDGAYIRLIYSHTNTSETCSPSDFWYQFEEGQDASAYAPYNGQTYTVNFGQTVYGGVLDVTRGKLTVTHGKYTLTDVSDLSRNSDHSFYFAATPAPKATGTAYYVGIMSDKFMPGETANQDVIFIHPNGLVRFNTANAYQSASDCFTAIGEITVVYPLATPFDIDLTPEVISAIVGTNNVFARCGETTVKYLKAGE